MSSLDSDTNLILGMSGVVLVVGLVVYLANIIVGIFGAVRGYQMNALNRPGTLGWAIASTIGIFFWPVGLIAGPVSIYKYRHPIS